MCVPALYRFILHVQHVGCTLGNPRACVSLPYTGLYCMYNMLGARLGIRVHVCPCLIPVYIACTTCWVHAWESACMCVPALYRFILHVQHVGCTLGNPRACVSLPY